MGATTFHTSTIPAAVRIDDVRLSGEESLSLSREIGWRVGESFALWGYSGMTLGVAGSYAVALSAAREALKIASEMDHRQWITAARCILGNLYADLGDLEAARAELEGALELARRLGSPYWVRSAAGWLASALIRADALVDAAEVLRENLTEETPRDTIAGRLLWCAAAELALARGEPACALDQINRLVEATPGACSRPIARLELLRGRALTALGQHEAAIAALTISREDAVWSGARPLLWRIEVERGRVFRARHLPKEENLAFASAQALIAELASGILDEALREQFLSYACGQLPGAPSSPVRNSRLRTSRL